MSQFFATSETTVPQRYLTFEQIGDMSAEGLWVLDENALATYVNGRAAEIFGYAPSEIIGRRVSDFLFPEDLGTYAERLAALKLARTERLEACFRHRDGREVWCLVSARTIHAEDGRLAGFFGVVSDITDRREAVEALHRSELLLRESQRIARVGSYVFDVAADRWTSSAVLDEIFGIDDGYRRDLAGWAALVHPDDRAMMVAYFQNLLATRDRFDKQYRVLRPSDGETRWVQGYGEIRLNAAGEPMRISGAIQDVTDHKRQEEERRRLEARLLQGQKLESLGVLAGGIAHEFNNLLTSILGNIDLALQDLPPDSPVREYILHVETASRRAAEISHQMLAYSGRGRFVVERIDVSRLVRDMAPMLEVSVPKGVSLRFDLRDGLPAVEADAAQLRQVVLNLVVNGGEALDPRQRGTVLVRTRVETCAEGAAHTDYLNEPVPPGQYMILEVADTGGGMDAETIARIFDPFFSTKFTGRGLGLPAALGVVRGHHGFIQVRSELGRGSTFRILLPVRLRPDVVPG